MADGGGWEDLQSKLCSKTVGSEANYEDYVNRERERERESDVSIKWVNFSMMIRSPCQ